MNRGKVMEFIWRFPSEIVTSFINKWLPYLFSVMKRASRVFT